MPEAFLADLSVAAIYNATDGRHASVTGLFDAPDAGVLADVMRGPRQSFLTLASGIDADPRGNGLVIDGVPYVIDDAQPDGTGWTSLLLNRAAPSGFATGFSKGFGL